MKWNKVFILLFPVNRPNRPRDPLLPTSEVFKRKYRIPEAHSFATKTISGYQCLPPPHSQFSQPADKPFAQCDLNSKLIVVAHGSDHGNRIYHEEFGGLDGASFARMLIDYGLTQVGLISMKACQAGKGEFLPTLVQTLIEEGVKIGWAIGYKSNINLQDDSITTSCWDVFTRPWHKLPDSQRVRIQQGNAFVPIPNSNRFKYR
ncbi:hypothetical protein Xsto_01779 [Xenorhabdus stockiae]|uniref:CHAT domain-containing protein n=1 Tax=Xenorhabdus stockiae TaxID=351614 RepID=A0A2D0KQB8_9GAMM|nr:MULTISPECIES: hypothetical protein [Xenorhabdus]PHM65630.1 hypothetical protein Xsto_01779 [Xenorhabdus stockiae]PHM68868.1 hypothetical protein Xekj_02943 [Xenorhabdus sp. KJ12.1]